MGQKQTKGACTMNGNSIRSFLGANSSEGFVSLYPQFTENCRTVIIKGGPGSGKSGIMKKIGAEAIKRGMFTEYCYCSSDPDSLDGIRIPEKNLCVADGTSPHLIEPKYPGAMDEIFNTGQFWDSEKLKKNLPEIRELNKTIKNCFAKAYRYLAAAGRVTEDFRIVAEQKTDRKKMKAFAADFVRKNLKKKSTEGIAVPRFLSGITPKGIVINRDTVYTLASRVYVLEDPCGIGREFLETATETGLQLGHHVYVFYNPLCPANIEHVVFPEGDFGIVTANKIHNFEAQNAYRIHLSRFAKADSSAKECWHNGKRLIEICLQEAIASLKSEKAYHDDLEEYYIEAMNFKKMNLSVQKLISSIFSDKIQKTH